jgi:hypothetical protein
MSVYRTVAVAPPRVPDDQDLIVLSGHVALNEPPGEVPQRRLRVVVEAVVVVVVAGSDAPGKDFMKLFLPEFTYLT